jgi:hypothetical protein
MLNQRKWQVLKKGCGSQKKISSGEDEKSLNFQGSNKLWTKVKLKRRLVIVLP